MSSCKLTGTLLSAVQACHQLIGLPDQLGWSSHSLTLLIRWSSPVRSRRECSPARLTGSFIFLCLPSVTFCWYTVTAVTHSVWTWQWTNVMDLRPCYYLNQVAVINFPRSLNFYSLLQPMISPPGNSRIKEEIAMFWCSFYIKYQIFPSYRKGIELHTHNKQSFCWEKLFYFLKHKLVFVRKYFMFLFL